MMSSNLPGAAFGRALAVIGAALAAAALTGAAAGAVSTTHGPDLVLVSLARGPARLAPGSTFSERFAEANRGDRTGNATTTSFYISRTRHLGRGAFRLRGAVRIQRLKAGRKTDASAWLTVSSSTPTGLYMLIACANDRHKIKERNTRNDCRVGTGWIQVAAGSRHSGSGSGGTSGTSGPSGGSGAAGGGSSCVPTRNPTLASTDPRCFDGDAAHGIFVSGLGDDANPGTIAAPKRTLAAAVGPAFTQGKDLYVAEGVFPETLKLANGVGVYGGYDATWQRSPSNITKITGTAASAESVDASGILEPTTLGLVTLEPSPPATPGQSSYGLRGAGSPGLRLDHVTIFAAPGASGAAGPAGARGASGSNGGSGKSGNNSHITTGDPDGGSSPAGHTGGDGGEGGYDGGTFPANNGAQGVSTAPDVWGQSGGFGGNAGVDSSNPTPGGMGFVGRSGHFGAEGAGGGQGNAATANSGAWLSDPGQNGQAGSPGHGGGGRRAAGAAPTAARSALWQSAVKVVVAAAEVRAAAEGPVGKAAEGRSEYSLRIRSARSFATRA